MYAERGKPPMRFPPFRIVGGNPARQGRDGSGLGCLDGAPIPAPNLQSLVWLGKLAVSQSISQHQSTKPQPKLQHQPNQSQPPPATQPSRTSDTYCYASETTSPSGGMPGDTGVKRNRLMRRETTYACPHSCVFVGVLSPCSVLSPWSPSCPPPLSCHRESSSSTPRIALCQVPRRACEMLAGRSALD